ncbi:MAG: amidohydrolase family protein, partial [candidate division NC10 bacterium]
MTSPEARIVRGRLVLDEEIVRGRLVLEDAIVPGRLHLEDGRISTIEPDDAEADGPLVAPGFVDVHVHGWGGHDAMGSREDLDGMARALLRHGVTSFLPTAVTAALDTLRAFADRVREWMPAAPVDGAAPLGFNLEGPFISPQRKGAQNPAFIADASATPFEALEPLLPGMRIMTVAPETPGGLDLVRWLAAHGVAPSLGHSAATVDEARAGRLDPVIGRDAEIRRVVRILSRKTKNNPVLIGEPGVGKTAIVEGLAQRIVRGDVPEGLKDKSLFALDMGSLVAGAK